MGHVVYTRESCRTFAWVLLSMQCVRVCVHACLCVCLSAVCECVCLCVRVFTCATWLIHMRDKSFHIILKRDMPHSHHCCILSARAKTRDMTHSRVRHDSFMCVIYTCDMTHSNARQECLICLFWRLFCRCLLTCDGLTCDLPLTKPTYLHRLLLQQPMSPATNVSSDVSFADVFWQVACLQTVSDNYISLDMWLVCHLKRPTYPLRLLPQPRTNSANSQICTRKLLTLKERELLKKRPTDSYLEPRQTHDCLSRQELQTHHYSHLPLPHLVLPPGFALPQRSEEPPRPPPLPPHQRMEEVEL